jgi:hypothetical protein
VISRPKARRGQVSGEEDGGEDFMEDEELQDAVDDMSKAESNQSIRRLKRRGNLNQSQDGSQSQMSSQERKLIEKKRREKERKQREMRKYLEMEAELGSDNEENDDVARAINREGDDEENEEGQDEDLKDFVVYAGDDQEIDDESADLYDKFQRDMEMQDRLNI